MWNKILLVSLLLIAGCAGTREVVSPPTPTTTEDLLVKPLGHDESIKSFRANLPKKTKVVKMIQRNVHYPDRVDTIYSFNYKDSRIAILKTHFNRELLLGGSIRNMEIPLKNGIATGMKWSEILNLLTDFKQEYNDTLVLNHLKSSNKITFYFDKKGVLQRYTFQGHVD